MEYFRFYISYVSFKCDRCILPIMNCSCVNCYCYREGKFEGLTEQCTDAKGNTATRTKTCMHIHWLFTVYAPTSCVRIPVSLGRVERRFSRTCLMMILKWYYDQKTLLFFLRISKLCSLNTPQAKF